MSKKFVVVSHGLDVDIAEVVRQSFINGQVSLKQLQARLIQRFGYAFLPIYREHYEKLAEYRKHGFPYYELRGGIVVKGSS